MWSQREDRETGVRMRLNSDTATVWYARRDSVEWRRLKTRVANPKSGRSENKREVIWRMLAVTKHNSGFERVRRPMFTLLVDNKRGARLFGNQTLRNFTLDETSLVNEDFYVNLLYSKRSPFYELWWSKFCGQHRQRFLAFRFWSALLFLTKFNVFKNSVISAANYSIISVRFTNLSPLTVVIS